MKKIILSALSAIIVGGIIFISCKPKNDSDAITPTYKDEAPGTGNNPNITNVTTTGTLNTTSTQQNSSLSGIGSGGQWSYTGCQAGQTCFSISNASTGTDVQLCFSSAPTSGTYTLVGPSALGPGKATLQITSPPSQDAGTQWFSYAGGSVVVAAPTGTNTTPYTCTFSNVACYQTQGSFYSVLASGQVGCQ